jgi:hypothetical protein
MEILGLALFVLVSGAALISMLAAIHLLLPIPVDKARQKLETLIGRSFLLGLVNLLSFSAVVALLLWLAQLIGTWVAGLLIFLAGLIALALAAFALNGLVALTSLLGERLGKTRSPFWSDTRGGLLLVLACLTPYLGWFFFLPALVCMGLGATVQTLFQRKTASSPVA